MTKLKTWISAAHLLHIEELDDDVRLKEESTVDPIPVLFVTLLLAGKSPLGLMWSPRPGVEFVSEFLLVEVRGVENAELRFD